MLTYYLSSFAMKVTTQRSMGNRKVAIPCLTDPVSKLNGCGQQICKNLSDIEEYAGPGMFLPPGFITEVTTGQSLDHCPKPLTSYFIRLRDRGSKTLNCTVVNLFREMVQT